MGRPAGVALVEGSLHEMGPVAYMGFDIIIGADQPRDFSNSHLDHTTTTMADELKSTD